MNTLCHGFREILMRQPLHVIYWLLYVKAEYHLR